MKKRYIIGLLICCLMILPLVGCTTKKATTTGTTQTPLQALSARVNSSDAVNTRQDQNITDLSNRITVVENRPQADISPLTARVGVLESLNMSTFAGDLSFLAVRVASLESYNISSRLAALEARPICNTTTTVIVTPTPTPTTIPTVNCSLVKKPVTIYPTNGAISIPNGSIMFQWVECNASGYKFYFGTDPAALTEIAILDKDVLAYPFPAPNPNTYYFWRVIALSPCGNQSTMWWFKTQ
jgi:hypothetical protein